MYSDFFFFFFFFNMYPIFNTLDSKTNSQFDKSDPVPSSPAPHRCTSATTVTLNQNLLASSRNHRPFSNDQQFRIKIRPFPTLNHVLHNRRNLRVMVNQAIRNLLIFHKSNGPSLIFSPTHLVSHYRSMTTSKRVQDRSKMKRIHDLEIATEKWKIVSKVLFLAGDSEGRT
ncbi:hypothetical protein Vadar_026996 [Vaccinium darrowii]|uniref:Uncharacterized protein n=1 Tax=Vaccinium darrowii TaxID=229202 RepID=A0ACB7X4X2_9ERIC|nr:hypothetical protein Vadar_026996 [Vaccinium darrowii]